MALTPGTRLNAYEIVAPIGAGAMGEVYRGRDTKLGRDVALKILPPSFTNDPDRVARFRREAQVLASLNHPHIAQIYGLDESNETQFLVLELVDGDMLDRRITRGRIPVDEALGIAKQIAEAFEAAHDQGIIHRDLKPANIALTKDGQVKVLDFGLAKAVETAVGSVDLTTSPAITSPAMMTGVGVILGTAAYMSPEQACGGAIDRRVDIWAFGCVVYEMLSARRCFRGNTITDVVEAIVSAEPDWTALPADIPHDVHDLLARCLTKDRKQRLHDIGDVRLEIEAVLADRSAAKSSRGATLGAVPSRRWTKKLIASLLALMTVATAVAAALRAGRLGSAAPTRSFAVRATIPEPTDQVVTGGQYPSIAISPDGRFVALRHGSGLALRPIDSFSATILKKTDRAILLAFSPDSKALAFFSAGHIRRMAIPDGPVLDVATETVSAGLFWGEDDSLYYSAGLGSAGIWRVPARGGPPQNVTHVDDAAGENAHTWPQLLPGGKAILFTALGASGGADDARVVVQSIGSNQRKTVATRAMFGRYVASGHLLYAVNDGTIFAQPFDSVRFEPTGPAVAVLSDVGTATWGGAAFLEVSDNGTAIALGRTLRQEYTLRTCDIAGRPAPKSFPFDAAAMSRVSALVQAPRLSPDGRRLAFTARTPGSTDVWIFDSQLGETERITFDPAEEEMPIWSPDGRSIAYTSAHTGTTRRIFTQSVESGTHPRLVRTWPRHVHVSSWSSDGRWLTVVDYAATGGTDVWAIGLNGRDAISIAETAANETNASFSPDGQWIAYESDASGRPEVYVVSFPDAVSRRQVSTDGGAAPKWDASGRVLYYLQDGHIIANDINLDGKQFRRGRARKLFATSAIAFEVTAGGFLLVEPNEAPTNAGVELIVNWLEELKQRVPTK